MSLTLLADEQWLRSNEAALREMFPETWTHGLNVLAIGYRLKLLGVDWRSDADLVNCLTYLARIGIVRGRQV